MINPKALDIASKKLRKLRLTTVTHLKDDGLTPCETVKSVLKSGLGNLYDDEAVAYILRHGIKYYQEALNELKISLCPACNCMTKTIKNKCGKCKAEK